MKQRKDNLAENRLVSRYKVLKLAFDAFKVSNQAMGSDSVALQRVVTGSSSDFHVSTSYHVIHGWEITYTANGEGIPNTGFLWHVFFNVLNVTGSGQQVTDADLVSYDNNVWKYRLWAMGSTSGQTLDYDVLVVVYAMSQGSISISQIQ